MPLMYGGVPITGGIAAAAARRAGSGSVGGLSGGLGHALDLVMRSQRKSRRIADPSIPGIASKRIDSVGITTLHARSDKVHQKLDVRAIGSDYNHTFVLSDANAGQHAEFNFTVALPALAANNDPTILFRSGHTGGTVLLTLVNANGTDTTYGVRFVYDGTDWINTFAGESDAS